MTLFQPKGDVLMGHDHRSPILFLRSFVVDEKLHFNFRDLAIFDFSLESRLATYFSRLGPFIAVGAPREQLAPAIGAARSALDDAEWQAQVVRAGWGSRQRGAACSQRCRRYEARGWYVA